MVPVSTLRAASGAVPVESVAGAAQAGSSKFGSGEESVLGSSDGTPVSCKELMAAMSKEGSPSCEEDAMIAARRQTKGNLREGGVGIPKLRTRMGDGAEVGSGAGP